MITTHPAPPHSPRTELVPAGDPLADVVSVDPERRGGTPCFAGTRVPVQDLWDELAAGGSVNTFLDSFPTVPRPLAVRAIRMAGDAFTDSLPRP